MYQDILIDRVGHEHERGRRDGKTMCFGISQYAEFKRNAGGRDLTVGFGVTPGYDDLGLQTMVVHQRLQLPHDGFDDFSGEFVESEIELVFSELAFGANGDGLEKLTVMLFEQLLELQLGLLSHNNGSFYEFFRVQHLRLLSSWKQGGPYQGRGTLT